ncbi:MAG TPA: OmpA family protein [Hyphomicrobiaceae bacterium]|nr:OmpA family protein [Hyphomicrobiaceae bacterium]
MRRTAIVLILLLCIGSLAAAIAGLQGDWRWIGLDRLSGVILKDPASQSPSASSVEAAAKELAALEQVIKPDQTSDEPRFDIARINPHGSSVFAGRAAAGGEVIVFADGKRVGSARTDENGEWVLVLEHTFASPDPALTLQFNKNPASAGESSQLEATTGAPNKGGETASSIPPKLAAASVTAALMDDLRQLVERARTKNASDGAHSSNFAPDQRTPTQQETTKSSRPENRGSADQGGSHEATTSDGSEEPRQEEQVAASSQMPRASPEKSMGPEKSTGPALATSVPVPIKFVFNEAVLTDDGRQAAKLLIEYVTLEKFKSLKLTGHADERGTHAYNLELSSERLKTVADMLRSAGYSGKLQLVAMGDTAPFTGIDRKKYSQEALYELDRRVELQKAQP